MAFTGAGVSVESGIPPFRGPGGLWSRYDPSVLDIGFYRSDPGAAWRAIKALFYDFFGQAKPNRAHLILADWERRGLVRSVVTQNIDGLHQAAGSRSVVEFHGSLSHLKCERCGSRKPAADFDLSTLPPACPRCGSPPRPDFVFFGEPIPEAASQRAFGEAEKADLVLVIGTTGEVMPASMIPRVAAERGAFVIEINPGASGFPPAVVDLSLHAGASEAMEQLERELDAAPPS